MIVEPELEIVNCTGFRLDFVRSDGLVLSLPPSGCHPYVKQLTEQGFLAISSIPVERVLFSSVHGLPPATPGKVFVVSAAVFAAVETDRIDVFTPGADVFWGGGDVLGAGSLVTRG